MFLNLKSAACTVSKGITSSHENYGVSIKKFWQLPAVLLVLHLEGEWKMGVQQRTERF